jgi:hypothetical protein
MVGDLNYTSKEMAMLEHDFKSFFLLNLVAEMLDFN